jgi:cytochrome bd ubiquinol oxidase subunit II
MDIMNIISYLSLQQIWWIIMLVLFIGFSLTDGFDMGVATLLPFIAKNDTERRIVINTIGATWEGNQVWLITAGAALFAAFPFVYATSFSTLYIALMLILFCLFLRPVGFDYRNKINNDIWRQYWDIALFIGGFIPSLVFGVAIGNIFLGLPFSFDEWMLPKNNLSFFSLFNPFALLTGVMSVLLLSLHGATWLNLKTSDTISRRSQKISKYLAIGFILCWLIGGYALSLVNGFSIQNNIVTYAKGLWLNRFLSNPYYFSITIAGIIAALMNIKLQKKHAKLAWLFSCLTIILFFANTAIALFPFMLPSTLNLEQSLTAFNASSSHKTLFCMLIAVVIFLPIILMYTKWVYKVLKGKIYKADIEKKNSSSFWY